MNQSPEWLKEENRQSLSELAALPNGAELILEAAADWLERCGFYREPAKEHVLRFAKERRDGRTDFSVYSTEPAIQPFYFKPTQPELDK